MLFCCFLSYRAGLQRAFGHALNSWNPPHETFAKEYLQQVHRGERTVRLDAFVWKDYYASIAWYRSLLSGWRGGTEPASPDSLQPGQHVYTFQETVQREQVARHIADTIDRYKDVVLVCHITKRR